MKFFKKFTLFFATYLSILFISFQGNMKYFAIGFLFLLFLFLFSLITWIVLIVLKHKTAALFFSLNIICVLVLISFFIISEINFRLTKKRANYLIESLTDFKNNNGYFPESLNNLKPLFLKEIPKPTFIYSDSFLYEPICLSDSLNIELCNSFVLKYFGPFEMEAKYTSKDMKWKYDD